MNRHRHSYAGGWCLNGGERQPGVRGEQARRFEGMTFQERQELFYGGTPLWFALHPERRKIGVDTYR